MELMTVSVDIDLQAIIKRMRPNELCELTRTLCGAIQEEGVIDRIRAIVNEAKYND